MTNNTVDIERAVERVQKYIANCGHELPQISVKYAREHLAFALGASLLDMLEVSAHGREILLTADLPPVTLEDLLTFVREPRLSEMHQARAHYWEQFTEMLLAKERLAMLEKELAKARAHLDTLGCTP